MEKQFKDLNLNSSYLFAAALSDPDTCKLVLQIILGREISKVNVRAENTILLSSDAKWIRLDISASDEFNVNYNIEAQNTDDANIVKRSRYYQAEMDVSQLKPGEDYDSLPESYVIFICTFDPFDKGLYKYTFVERCEENGMYLGDGTHKIFLNTKGTNADEIPQVLVHFLEYFVDSTDKCVKTVNDKSISQLHEKISNLKKSREWEAGYMKMSEILERTRCEGIKEGIEEGLREGRSEGLKLGHQNALTIILEDIGGVSDEIKEKINTEDNIEVLDKWIKLAAASKSIEEFEKKM